MEVDSPGTPPHLGEGEKKKEKEIEFANSKSNFCPRATKKSKGLYGSTERHHLSNSRVQITVEDKRQKIQNDQTGK